MNRECENCGMPIGLLDGGLCADCKDKERKDDKWFHVCVCKKGEYLYFEDEEEAEIVLSWHRKQMREAISEAMAIGTYMDETTTPENYDKMEQDLYKRFNCEKSS